MAGEEKSSKIIFDEDWKQQAQTEKEKLSQKDKDASAESGSPASTHALPAASFSTLVESLMIQTLYALGKIADPSGPAAAVNLDLAKHHIDILQVLQDKTKNNLTEEESQMLAVRLHEVRMHYVEVAQQPPK